MLTWVDPKDTQTYAAVPSAQGLTLYTNSDRAANTWTARNLTAEILGAGAIVSSLTTFTSVSVNVVDRLVHVAGLTADGRLLLYRQTGATDSQGNYTWSATDLGAHDLAPQGQTLPAFVGELVSYVTPLNGLNIAGLDASGHIHSVWWAPGLTLWRTADLSASTGAPPYTGALTAYVTSYGGINLAGLNSQGQVLVTWWVPGFGGNWRVNNLTQQFAGPGLTASSVSSYVTPWDGLNIAGIDASTGDLTVYWWAPGQDHWLVSRLNDAAQNPILPVGRLTGVAAPTGVINVLGTDSDGEVIRYWWQPGAGGTWTFENLSVLAVPQ